MLKGGLIKESSSGYRSPVQIVMKPNNTIRMTVDYKTLNAITVNDTFPLPNIHDMLSQLATARIFSKLDLSHGYFQIKMDPKSRKYTAFGCARGLFEYLMLPIGLTNRGQTFSRLMLEVLKGYIGKFCYVILIFSSLPEEHEKHVIMVLERMNEYNK